MSTTSVSFRALAVAALAAIASTARGDNQDELTRRLEHEYNIRLISSAETEWTSDVLTELLAGIEMLPVPMRQAPGGALELQLHRAAQPFGMGDGSAAAPDWSTSRRRFHLYSIAPSTEPRATYRLEHLSPALQTSLWRRRAIVHAMVQRWDDALGLSKQQAWRRISGWLHPLEHWFTWRERALNTYDWAFSRAEGKQSAALDLVTFAEEAFVPVEGLSPQALNPDDRVVCQEFSKWGALFQLLTEHHLIQAPPARGSCPAFDQWADEPSLQGFEVLFVAASGRRPESFFGHVMLRPVRQPTAFVAGPSFQSIVQLVALTGGDTPGLPYLIKGITGGYSMTVLTTPFGDIRRQMSEFEQRTIRRFRIHLTAPEQIRLLQRIWELERRGYWAYFFFTDNCASNLILLLNSVLDPEREISVPGRFSPVFPSATLDFMSDVTVQSGESSQARTSLLEPVPDNFESTQDVARAADARREVLAPPLRAVFDTKLSTEFMHWHARSKYPDPVQRARAYEGLAQVFSLALTRAGTSWLGASLTYEYLFQTVRVERYAVDAAEAEALKARGAAQERLPRKTSDTFDEASLRQSTFQHEALLQHALPNFDRTGEQLATLNTLPLELLTDEERATVRRSEITRNVFSRLTQLQGALVDRYFAAMDATQWLDEEHQLTIQRQAASLPGALSHSGFGQAAIGLGATSPSMGVRAPTFTLRSFTFAEEMGDQRLHGLQPSAGIEVLGGDLLLQPSVNGIAPRVVSSDFTFVSFRTLLLDLPSERQTWAGNLGWGGRAGWDYRSDEALPYHAEARAEVLQTLYSDSRYQNFTALGLGGMGQARWNALDASLVLGPRVSLAHRSHLWGSSANALRLEASYLPAIKLRPGVIWIHETQAMASVSWLVGEAGHWAFLLRPEVSASWRVEPGLAPGAATQARAALFVEVQ